jgi:hypothetical protein
MVKSRLGEFTLEEFKVAYAELGKSIERMYVYFLNPKKMLPRNEANKIYDLQDFLNEEEGTLYIEKESYLELENHFLKQIKHINNEDKKNKINPYASVPAMLPEYFPRDKDFNNIKKLLITSTHRRIGLYGMGGVGKSIFSIVLANDKEVQKYFKDGIYYIKFGQNPDITSIKSELLYYLENENISQINAKLKELFSNKKALLIIDDIWNIDDFKDFEILNNNSKLLITTRDKDILLGLKATDYHIDVLSKEQALCFLKQTIGNINESMENMSVEILNECGNLPLAINIIGSLLKGKDIEWWHKVLKDLIQNKLHNIKLSNTNKEHENLFNVIDTSVSYLNEDTRNKYLSLVIFQTKTVIPRVTLKNFWGDNYLEYIQTLSSLSLLFESKDKKNKYTYTLHELQYHYIQYVGKEIDKYYKEFIEIYKETYNLQWHNITIDDYYFYSSYLDICDKLSLSSLAEEISNSILFNQPLLSIVLIKQIIKQLELNDKVTAIQLLNKNKHPDSLIWILNTLGKENQDVKEFAKKYIEQDINDLNGNLTIKCLDILGKEIQDVKEFAKKYIEQDINDLNGVLTIKCLDILGKENQDVKEFAKSYFSLKGSHLAIIRKCFSIIDKNNKDAIEYAKQYIESNFSNLGDFTVNSALSFLQDDNEYKKQLGLREFNKLKNDKSYLKSNPDRKSQILKIMIDDKLREDVALQELHYLFHFFPSYNSFYFRNDRNLINSCLLVFKKHSNKINKYAKKILKNYYKEIIFRDKKNYSYHWHIKTALENTYIEKYAIDIAKRILLKENELTFKSFINRDCEYYYISWILEDTLFELVRTDIKSNKNNLTEMKKVYKILSNLYNTRKKIYELCLKDKVLGYINILNVMSFYEEVIGDMLKAIEYKEEALELLKNSKLLNQEEKIEQYIKELKELKELNQRSLR